MLMASLWALLALCSCLAVAARVVARIIFCRSRRRAAIRSQRGQSTSAPSPVLDDASPSYNVLCVLGSGGHTAEMLVLVSDLLSSPACPGEIIYLSTTTDDHSLKKAHQVHLVADSRAQTPRARVPLVVLATIPRAREVHQSWASTVNSSVYCLFAAVPVVFKAKPDVILVNGPGSSVIVVGVALLLNALGITKAARVVYVESVARVSSLSLSGKILYHVADRFIVQWPSLESLYPLAEFHGRLN